MAIPRWLSCLVEMPRSERGVKGQQEDDVMMFQGEKGGFSWWVLGERRWEKGDDCRRVGGGGKYRGTFVTVH